MTETQMDRIMADCYACLLPFKGHRATYKLSEKAVMSSDPAKIWDGPFCPNCGSDNVEKSACRLPPDHDGHEHDS